jgi:D-lactate dehydrogenase
MDRMSTLLSNSAVEELRACLMQPERLLLGTEDCLAYSYDNSKRSVMPQAVALCVNAKEVADLLRVCHERAIPVTARGRGTNTTGASVPIAGGLVISLERMQRIIEINTADRYAVVEPGVLNGDLQAALKPLGFFWPPDPTSAPFSSIGGNLACNAGGPRAVKYGACRDNILALQAVDGRGELFSCGALTSKHSVGYDLTRFLVGSEGTLGIITQATLKLVPLPNAKRALRLLFSRIEDAAAAVARIMAQPVTPCALEFIDHEALALVRERGVALPPGDALLLVEVDAEASALDAACKAVLAASEGPGLTDVLVAHDADQTETLWAARKALSPALRRLAPKKINEDVVVPVSRLPELMAGVDALASEWRIRIVNFGHAGNGNIHVNLLIDPSDPVAAHAADRCLDALFDLVIRLRGTLSGEHGIGLAKRDFMPRAIDAHTLALMRAIKTVFDPQGILNPGKLLPDS